MLYLQFTLQIPNDVDLHVYNILTGGVSPFLYVLGMSEFRDKVEELLGGIWEGMVNIGRKCSCRNNQIHPSGEEILPLDNRNKGDEQLPGTSGFSRDEGTRETAL